MNIADATANVRQLTIGEIQDLLDDDKKRIEKGEWEPDIVDLLFPGRIPMKGILKSTGMKSDDFRNLDPDEMEKIIERVESKNPHFAQMAKRLGKLIAKV